MQNQLRVLVGCEYSGTVRDAFASLGHFAVSCDLLPTESYGMHYQGDVRDLLDGWAPVYFSSECDPEGMGLCCMTNLDVGECPCYGPTQDELEYKEVNGQLLARPIDHPHWDIAIFHPPCTHLATSGARWFKDKVEEQAEAVEFVKQLMSAPIPHIALENPVGVLSSRYRKPDQIVQPWMFGDSASKRTCLWLKGLPPLVATDVVDAGEFHVTAGGKKIPAWYNIPQRKDRWKMRSKTFEGFAYAMATQFSQFVVDLHVELEHTLTQIETICGARHEREHQVSQAGKSGV